MYAIYARLNRSSRFALLVLIAMLAIAVVTAARLSPRHTLLADHAATAGRVTANQAFVGAQEAVATAETDSLGSRLKAAAPSGQPAEVSLLHLPPPPHGSRAPSQLIRTANISLKVADVGKALRAATLLTDEQLGDVIALNDDTPSSSNAAHTATMAIRVPQYRFESTLDALARLGSVESRSVNAQDVSDQLIDAQARLRNLRRTEADMLAIMDRSGNIDQVLNVTQQIASVREQIERLDAQIQRMQYQVAYSTINIVFTTPPLATEPTGFALLGTAWQQALASLRDVTVWLLSIGLWLVAFSPYALVLLVLLLIARQRLRMHAADSQVGRAS